MTQEKNGLNVSASAPFTVEIMGRDPIPAKQTILAFNSLTGDKVFHVLAMDGRIFTTSPENVLGVWNNQPTEEDMSQMTRLAAEASQIFKVKAPRSPEVQ